jgi:NAD dependent epimerase/dehydratase family enzyme
MSWIHADDAVSLILFAVAGSKLCGAVNAAAPNPVTNGEFTAALAAAVRRPALLRAPERLLRLIYGEMAEIVLASQRVEPRAALDAGFEFRYPALRGALQNLVA